MRGKTSIVDAQSISSHRSDLSATIFDPNSTRTTPLNSCFPTSAPLDHPNLADGDVENDLDRPVPGWPRVAMLMAKTPDFASFSRFRDLNIKSLLYYQAELTKLRAKLHEEEWQDYRRGDEDAREFASRADYLIMSEDEVNHRQWDIMKQIRVLLKEYSESKYYGFHYESLISCLDEALLQYSQICALPEPETHNMKSLRKWLRDQRAGNFCIGGNGEQNTWGYLYDTEKDAGPLKWQFLNLIWTLIWPKPDPPCELDLVSPLPSRKVDGFSRWIATRFIPFYANWCKYRQNRKDPAAWKNPKASDEEKSQDDTSAPQMAKPKPRTEFQQETLATYSQRSILRFTSSVSTVVACLLPTIAITVLSQVHGTRNLLLCLAGFAVVFAFGVIFLTNGTASRVEIFTATAA